jgi:hypothetical protein
VQKRYLSIFISAFLAILFISAIYYETDDSLARSERELIVETPLWCFEQTTNYFWESTEIIGCMKEEQSLGSTQITAPSEDVFDLNSKVKIRFLAAQAQAELEGVDIYITSGYRSKDRQLVLFNEAVKKYKSVEEASKWVLPPDLSHHPKGIALDVNYPTGPAGAQWLEVNGYKFGLCRVYENEWWHFEPLVAPGQGCPALVANALTPLN